MHDHHRVRDTGTEVERVMALKSVEVNLSLPFGVGGLRGVWQPDQEEQKAAWEMYVELITRIAVVELGPSEGLLREALSSLS
jgi:hypothetical protein